MKVLVIARDAQIRNALVTQFGIRSRQYQCVGDDWLSAQSKVVSIPTDVGVVVNAITLEQLQGPSGNTSFGQVERLASACEATKRVLIQLSSSEVFDGVAAGRHRESEQSKPDSNMGLSLLKAEQIIAAAGVDHIILRTGPLFSAADSNVLTQLIEQFKKKQTLSLSNTSSGCPLHVGDLARVISGIIDQLSCGGLARGIYHYHSSDPASRFKFAETVLAALMKCNPALGEGVELVSEDHDDSSWSHPLLNCEKILNTFGIKQLPWRSFVIQTVEQLVKQAD